MFFIKKGKKCARPHSIKMLRGRSFIIIIIMILSFYALNKYRQNSPLAFYSTAPNFALETYDGLSFSLYDYKTPLVLIFFNDYSALSNNMYSYNYRRILPQLNFLSNNEMAQIAIIFKGIDKKEQLIKLRSNKKFSGFSDMIYIPIDGSMNIAKNFGVRSWPHYFLLDEKHRIIDEAKIFSLERIVKKLRLTEDVK